MTAPCPYSVRRLFPFCTHNEYAYAHEVRRKRGWLELFRDSPKKLKPHSCAELVRYAIEDGLIELG
mgnify:CR=1 FL=1